MRWRRLLIVLAVCAALAAIVLALIPREPKYDGRTLSEWIKDSAPQRSSDPKTTRAIEAVRHIGTNGLPWLIKWISCKDPPPWRVKLIAASANLPGWMQTRLVPALLGERSYEMRRRTALDGFLILGAAARPAILGLLQIAASSAENLPDLDAFSSQGFEGRRPPDLPTFAALENIGWEVVLPKMLDTLTNRANSAALRMVAASWLTQLEPALEKEAIQSFLTQSFQNNSKLKSVAARMLARRRAEESRLGPQPSW